jgi:MSHA pilin protein MshA
MNSTDQSGFTWIEVVVVITILGILAAFAVPRFASLEGQARLASTQALAGSVRSGAALSHALWVAEGDSATDIVTMEGIAVTLENGYPTIATIDDTIVDYSGFLLTTPDGTARFTKTSPTGTAIANCFVSYMPPSAANEAPTVTTTTGGC